MAVGGTTPLLTPAPGGFGLDDLALVLLVGGLVLVVAVALVRFSTRTGLPSLVLYLGIGLLIGESGLGLQFDNAPLSQVLGYAALVVILVEGGLSTSWAGIRRSVAPAAALSTVGVLVSVAVVASAAHYLLRMPLEVALVLGAVLASTDAAAVFSVLRRVPLPSRISGMLEAESGFNDAPVVVLVTSLASVAAGQSDHGSWLAIGGLTVLELAGGAVVGLAVGWGGGWAMRHIASGSSTLFAIGVVAVAVLAYAAADLVHTSGFLACYLAGLVLANTGLPHRQAVVGFASALGWLAHIGLFVMLGLLASPSGFVSILLPALVVGLVLLLVARPLSVVVSCTPFRVPWRTQAFLSWAGLRGAVPVVLATVPITMGAQGLDWLFDLVFVLVLIFTLIQAPTLPWVAQRLGVTVSHHTYDLGVEATPVTDLGADLLAVDVGPGSQLAGVSVAELRLPGEAGVSLIVRDGHFISPREHMVLRRGDHLVVVTPAGLRAKVVDRLQAVSRHGRLAGWKGKTRPQRGR